MKSRLVLAAITLSTVIASSALFGASPAGSTIQVSSPPTSWSGTGLGGASPEGETTCVEGITCDSFTLTLGGTPADWSGKVARVDINWLLPATDYDLYIHKGSVTGPVVADSGNATTTLESGTIDPSASGTGVYIVRIVYWAALSADQYKGTVTVVNGGAGSEPPPPASTATPPSYATFASPAALGNGAGEPTIGINHKTNKAMFISGVETLRVSFDGSNATWLDRSGLTTSITTFDPILFTDPKTGRTLVSQLLPSKVSLMAFTDDDGETWTPSQGSGINAGVDHQTVGGGPFKAGILGRGPLTAYPNAVYYASQDIGVAQIALSRDGGMTFDVAVPMWDLTRCGGLHGHIKVAPDGTVYVPNKSCGGNQAVAVSEDNGLTWNIRPVPKSTPGDTDPSVGIGADGTIYFGYANGDGHPRVAVSRDRGITWTDDQDLGHGFGLQNTVFPAATAGDGDRAAIFYLASTKAGAEGRGVDMNFDGVWHGYISTTYDGGKSWVTVRATGDDPAQRGVVCTQGTTCPSGTRNLLDFNDLEIDRDGRPLAAFADGCTSEACRNGVDRDGAAGTPDGKVDSYDNDGSEKATILRQAAGLTLFASMDPAAAPSALTATAAQAGSSRTVNLSWADNAKNESGYTIERSTSPSSGFTRLTSLGANTTSFTDTQVARRTTFYYRVIASNSNGDSSASNVAKAYVK